MSDRIEAATYLMAAIATGGEVAVDGLTIDHLPTVVELLVQRSNSKNRQERGSGFADTGEQPKF